MMKFKLTSIFAICTLLVQSVFSQEVESDLLFMDLDSKKGGAAAMRGGSPAMSLPFLDDFA